MDVDGAGVDAAAGVLTGVGSVGPGTLPPHRTFHVDDHVEFCPDSYRVTHQQRVGHQAIHPLGVTNPPSPGRGGQNLPEKILNFIHYLHEKIQKIQPPSSQIEINRYNGCTSSGVGGLSSCPHQLCERGNLNDP